MQNHYELQSYTSIAFTKHFLKFGARIRDVTDSSNSNGAFFARLHFSSSAAFQTMIQGLNNGMSMAQIIAGTTTVNGQTVSCNTSGVSNSSCPA